MFKLLSVNFFGVIRGADVASVAVLHTKYESR